MASPDYIDGRAEGLALAIYGIATAMQFRADYTRTLDGIAGWLVTNGGYEFVKQLAKAIEAEEAK